MNKTTFKFINDYIKSTISNLKLNLLGPKHLTSDDMKRITFSFKKFDPKTTVEAAYLDGNLVNNGMKEAIDAKTVDKLEQTAISYLDKLESKSITDVHRVVTNYSHEQDMIEKTVADLQEQAKRIKSLKKDLKKQLEREIKSLNYSATMIVEDQLNQGQAFGSLDGILAMSKSIGIDDPTVVKIPVKDKLLCVKCRNLHLMPDGVTPKAYKLSELAATAGDYKNPVPSIGPAHINCRCQITLISPNFGFRNGRIDYIGKDHDEYKHQNS